MFGLIGRGEMEGVVESEFEHLTTRLQHLWLVEHNEDGTHRNEVDLSGVAALEHTHDAADVVSGTFDTALIPDLAASKITSGTFNDARIPNLDASKITSGAFDKARQHAQTAYKDEANTFTELQTIDHATAPGLSLKVANVLVATLAASDNDVYLQLADTFLVTNPASTFTNFRVNADGSLQERNRSMRLGEWTAVTYNAGDFLTDGATTWTVDVGDVIEHRYTLIGKTMHVSFHFATTSVSGVSGYLSIPVPGGFTSAGHFRNIYHGNNAGGGYETGFAYTSSGSNIIRFYRPGTAAWNAATNNTLIAGQLTLEIQ